MIFNEELIRGALSDNKFHSLKEEILNNVRDDYKFLDFIKKGESKEQAMEEFIKIQAIMLMSTILSVVSSNNSRITFETTMQAFIGPIAVACEVHEEEMNKLKKGE